MNKKDFLKEMQEDTKLITMSSTEKWIHENKVSIESQLDEYGAVLDPYVVESNPGGIFDRASIKAVRKLIYEPPLFEEKAVPVRNVQLTVVFKLQ